MAKERKKRVRVDVDCEYWTQGEGMLQVKKWIQEDKIFDNQIAKNIGITPQTLINWKKKYEAFNMLFNTYRGIAALEVVNAVYKSAMGYYVDEQMLDSQGNKKLVRKYIKPEVGAQLFLLKNWMPKEYKDKPEMVVEGNVSVNAMGGLSTEDLKALVEKLTKDD